MGCISHKWIDEYFKQRPQLKKPAHISDSYRIDEEWVPLISSLIAIVERPSNDKRCIHSGCVYQEEFVCVRSFVCEERVI